MIVIVSSIARERAAYLALVESRAWPAIACENVRSLSSLLRRSPPRVILLRHRLVDGYSDDVFATLDRLQLFSTTRVIVLVTAETPPAVEARQIALGADCVQRDPVRTEVLAEYLAKYIRTRASGIPTGAPSNGTTIPFAGGRLDVTLHTLEHQGRCTPLTRREIQLAELLAESSGVVSYDTLYSEILGRRFRGDTSNMRVLLGKLLRSTSHVGINLRQYIQVIRKSGYRFQPGRTEHAGTAVK